MDLLSRTTDSSQTNVLFVGSEGTGKHAISCCLLEMGKAVNLKAITCSCLPLHDDRDLQQENVNFICFVMHMTRKDSMKTLVGNMGLVDISYFTGNSVIIANTKGQVTGSGVELTKLKILAAKYDIQVLFCDTEVESERTELCRKLMRMIEAAVGWRNNVSPLLFETVQIL